MVTPGLRMPLESQEAGPRPRLTFDQMPGPPHLFTLIGEGKKESDG